jgi:hypothetical protein
VLVFAAILLSTHVIYCTGFNASFGWFPPLTIVSILGIGVSADAVWHRVALACQIIVVNWSPNLTWKRVKGYLACVL